ncbi:pectate lyase [Ferruginibacter sp. HRS2-29]|nr:pectate lyase [Ferruginibacter sp. HRS2-29]
MAFPGAEGFGKYTTGGRGGRVVIVSNLNDKGPGSLREAVTAKDTRTIIFSISGTIHLEKKLVIAGNCTIAGQSAPGDGICIADKAVSLGGNNIIVRYLRFRMGDRYANEGMVDGAGGDDALGGTHRSNIIIDHCSISWSTDEAFSVYAGDSTTLQYNIISEPLNYSYHFETGDKDFEHHGYGAIWGGKHFSAHHNLFAHCANRTPRFDGIRNIPEENADITNNVIYNWEGNNTYAGEGGTYNIINNYYKYGPSTKRSVAGRIANPYKSSSIPFGKWYVDGNFVDGSPDNTADNWKGVNMEKGNADDKMKAKLSNPFAVPKMNIETAEMAYNTVLQYAGADFPRRDSLDTRIVNDVRNRTGRIIDVQGGFPHGTPYGISKTAWPTLISLPAPRDTDQDGIPDEWEKERKLDPNDPKDASLLQQGSFYTHIEMYLNNLIVIRKK